MAPLLTQDAIVTEEPPPTTASSFQLLWDNLSDLIGTSATATLVRRAARHAERSVPNLARLAITKPAFDYVFAMPDNWADNGREELMALIRTLQPLLVELTGPIVVQRLRTIPALEDMLLEEDRES